MSRFIVALVELNEDAALLEDDLADDLADDSADDLVNDLLELRLRLLD